MEQQWVAVQEKTFTKWSVETYPSRKTVMTNDCRASRLNAKVSDRDVAVKNLVTDLSDGVNPILLACKLRSKCQGCVN